MNKQDKIKKRIRRMRSWVTDIPVPICIFLMSVGLIVGSVFVFTSWREGKIIDKSDAIPLTGVYTSYNAITTPSVGGGVGEIEIILNGSEKLYIDGACFADAEAELNNLSSGKEVDFLLHPISNYIWEMKSGDAVILSFEDSRECILKENVGYSTLGAFLYLCAVFGSFSLFLQLKDRRKRKVK